MNLAVKNAIANAFAISGLVGIAERLSASIGSVVFALHRVLPDDSEGDSYNPHLIVSPESLDQFLAFLVKHFRVESLSHLLEEPGIRTGKPRCALTFDDGWEDNYRFAFPLLRKYSLPALIYLPTFYISNRERLPEDRFWRAWHSNIEPQTLQKIRHESLAFLGLPESSSRNFGATRQTFKRLPYSRKIELLQVAEKDLGPELLVASPFLTWEQIETMSGHGISFGSHTAHHCLLAYEESETVRRELTESRGEIRVRLGYDAEHFAYPSGSYDAMSIRAVRDAGYKSAATTKKGVFFSNEQRFAIPRVAIDNTVLNGPRDRFSINRTRLHLLRSYYA